MEFLFYSIVVFISIMLIISYIQVLRNNIKPSKGDAILCFIIFVIMIVQFIIKKPLNYFVLIWAIFWLLYSMTCVYKINENREK